MDSCLAASMKPQVLTSDHVGVVRVVGQGPAGGLEPPGKLLGVDLVARAAEGHQADGALRPPAECSDSGTPADYGKAAPCGRGRTARRSGAPRRVGRQPAAWLDSSCPARS